MIIYKITNLIDGKCYIGQSVNNFKTRYSGGKWWTLSSSSHLRNAVSKHGLTNFKVEFLEENVDSLELLNELEVYYAELYNAYSPNGYNLVGCGHNRKFLQWQKDLLSDIQPKKKITLRVVDTWELIEFEGLRKFARENKLNCPALRNMINKLNGTIISQGFCLPERTREEVDAKKKRNWKNDPIDLIRPDGTLVSYSSVKEASLRENINNSGFRHLMTGNCHCFLGYTLQIPVRERIKAIYNHIFISPEGDEFFVDSLKSFCKEHKICSKGIRSLIKGSRENYKGWRLKINQNKDETTIIVDPQ